MKNITNYISKLITMAVVLVVGILCIVANAADGTTAADAYESISIVLGSVFIAISALAIIAEAIVYKSLINDTNGVSAGVLLALGIFFVCDKYIAGNLLSYLVNYVPYVLLVVGSMIIVDAILVLVFSIIKKKDYSLAVILVEIGVGLIALLFGILAFTVDGIKNNKFMILGIILIIYSVFGIITNLFALLSTKKKISVDAENVVDAEATVVEEEVAE